MKKISLILFFALCAFISNNGYAQCGPEGCVFPTPDETSLAAQAEGGVPAEPGQEYFAGECYCLVCKYEPQYRNKWRCEWDTKSYQVKRCKKVPQTYQKTRVRYVPQYYKVDCVRYVPQYYTTTETKKVPRYVCDRECKYVPKYYYKRISNQTAVPSAPAAVTAPTPESSDSNP
ncbi:hypothetical protein [Parachlamydia sp. AcF125]|uniref:hypothetical protein n=1 Tax=Parachlamydia sp. AcF125 TaxID=2795736 RepID=UPI001BD8F782|nr:hypothetical protein [Parachlamydia sp. AcF125]MBS4169272.1 hypothetical protein [Parachlamydia sp. AcF125]